MIKYIFLFFSLVCIMPYVMKAQDTAQADWHAKLKKALGMNKDQFSKYIKGKKAIEQQLNAVLKDTSRNKNNKAVLVGNLLAERRAYNQKQLTEEQRRKLQEFVRQYGPASPRTRQRKELEERLAKKGIKVVGNQNE